MTMIAERTFTCPTCGSEWDMDEVREETVSKKREYCQMCVSRLDTAEMRWKWFVERDGRYKRLAMYYLTDNPRGFLAVDPERVVKWAREDDADGFEDTLREFIYKVSGDKIEYWEWLLSQN